MPRQPVERQLADDDGITHDYAFTAHPATDGLRLAQQLFALAGPAIGRVIDGLRKGTAEQSLLDVELDWSLLIREVSAAVVAADVPVLAQELLRHTVRDKAPLGNQLAFNMAYGANYGELAEALVVAVEVNGFVRFFERLMLRTTGAKNG